MKIFLIILLSILAILLLWGKGGFLIAGYNVLSKEEKRSYDMKKTGRVLGIALVYVDAGLILELAAGEFFSAHTGLAFILGIVLLILCVIAIFYVLRKNPKGRK